MNEKFLGPVLNWNSKCLFVCFFVGTYFAGAWLTAVHAGPNHINNICSKKMSAVELTDR